jgi:signal transduction histidine kinase/DNA-binding response OmpR family regulator/AraC-like DNA-binding protein
MKILAFLLLFIPLTAFAQQSKEFRIDTLPTEGMLLDKNWKWQVGDNPDFAKPDFDDSAWDAIDPTKDIMDLTQIPKDGRIVWLRLHLHIDSTINQQLALMIQQVGASDLFLNGKHIHSFGVLSEKPNEIKAFNPSNMPISFPFTKDSIQILSVRIGFQPNVLYCTHYGMQNPAFKCRLITENNSSVKYGNFIGNGVVRQYARSAVFTILAILFFALFLFFPTRKANLYFSLHAFFFAISWYIFPLSSLPNFVENFYILNNSTLILYVIAYLFMLNSVYTILEQKRSWFYKSLVIIGILSIPIGLFIYGWGWMIFGQFFSNLINIDITRIAILAARKNRKGAWIILLGSVCYLVIWALFSLQFHQKIGSLGYFLDNYIFDISAMCIPVTFAIFLGFDFGQTNLSLQQKLIENENLSQEKQQILATQNETLEKQVTERTTELAGKNHELEIEAALEKIRSCSLGMHHSEEIKNVVSILFEKLKELNLVFDSGAAIHVFTEGSKDAVIWVADPDLSGTTCINLPYDENAFENNPIITDIWHAKGTGEHIYNKFYAFEEKNTYFNYVFKYNDCVKIPQSVREFILRADSYTASFIAGENSLLGATSWTRQLFSDNDLDILKRVAKVFEQAYTRFLDLQKAEAQAEQAKLNLIYIQTEKNRAEDALIELKKTQAQLVEKEKIASSAAVQLKELDVVKTRLYTNITHEFRTPLTVILGMAQQAMDKPQEHLQEGLTMITRNGQNLLNLVNQMLDLNKLESGKLDLQYQQVDVVNFLKYIVESLHSLAENKGITMHFLTDLDTLTMDIEENRLQQVVSNLLSNAVKFTPKGGNIYMTIGRNNGTLSLKVKDTGVGISEEQLPYIFDRFYQADTTATRHGEGTGIGLSLTRELVKLMNGTIAVKSHPHKGSEFEVTLPITHLSDMKETNGEGISIAENKAILLEESPLILENQSKNNEKPLVLIADDNADVRAYIASCLAADYNLLIAKDGRECENIAFEKTPDLIISDVMMPFKDGFEVCKTLKTDERTSHIPIIMLTAKADIDSKLQGFEHGADAYLMKPFNKEELLLRIKKLLELRQQLQQYYLNIGFGVSDLGSNKPKSDVQNAQNTEGGKNLIAETPIEKNTPYINSFDNSFVVKVKTTIEKHISDADLDIEKLARNLALSTSQLNRKLTALTGLSTNNFMRYVRLIKAKELLLHSGFSITAIAYDSGFNDPAYFIRVFKQEFGVTPQVWREQNVA